MTGHPYTFLFSSGHHTPGSRLYSDLVDSWADYTSIHQFIFKPCSKSARNHHCCQFADKSILL